MRTFLMTLLVTTTFAVGVVLTYPMLERGCADPATRMQDALCPQSAIAIRTIRIQRERGAMPVPASAPTTTRGAYATPVPSAGHLVPGSADGMEYDPGRPPARGELARRWQDVRTQQYEGQGMADEAIGALEMVSPELAQDPLLRAGLRAGGVALDAGQAIDKLAGPEINRAAARVEGFLSKLRPPE